jgi:3-oxoadipate enol-lactonase
MSQQAVEYEDFDIPLKAGRLRVRRWGAGDAPAVLCVPGLSANLCGFDRLAERLADDTRQPISSTRNTGWSLGSGSLVKHGFTARPQTFR